MPAGITPALNLPKLRRKNLTVHSNFPSIRAPWYVPQEAMPEGCAVKKDDVTNVAAGTRMCGTGEGAKAIGLSLQSVYDTRNLGDQFSQLEMYHFGNDTAQRLDFSTPVGVLQGQGFADIRNYVGAVGAGADIYIGPSGTLVTTGHSWAVSNNKLPIKVIGIAGNPRGGNGQDGDKALTIAFNFPLV